MVRPTISWWAHDRDRLVSNESKCSSWPKPIQAVQRSRYAASHPFRTTTVTFSLLALRRLARCKWINRRHYFRIQPSSFFRVRSELNFGMKGRSVEPNTMSSTVSRVVICARVWIWWLKRWETNTHRGTVLSTTRPNTKCPLCSEGRMVRCSVKIEHDVND